MEHDWADAPAALDALAAVDAQLERFVPLATWHRCGAASWLGVRSTELADTSGGRELEKRYREGIARHLRVVSDLAGIGSALRSAAVPFAVVKGPVLSTTLYSRPDLRFYDDVDVLVPPAAFGAAIDALEGIGCVVRDANWTMLEKVVAGQIHLATPLGTVIDLHWNLVNEHAFRDAFPVDTEILLGRAVDVIINGTAVPTLGAVDTLTHLCLHAAMAGANRLGWLKDVDRAVTAVVGEWQDVVDRSHEWRAGSAIGTVLARASRFLSTPVPEETVAGLLGGPPWRLLTTVVDVTAPCPGTRHGGSVDKIVARAGRSTSSASTLELARRCAAWVGNGGPFATEHDPWQVSDSLDPRSATFTSGDRRSYLELISRQPRLQPRRLPFRRPGRQGEP